MCLVCGTAGPRLVILKVERIGAQMHWVDLERPAALPIVRRASALSTSWQEKATGRTSRKAMDSPSCVLLGHGYCA